MARTTNRLTDDQLIDFLTQRLSPTAIAGKVGLTVAGVRYRLKQLKLKNKITSQTAIEITQENDNVNSSVNITTQEQVFLDLYLVQKVDMKEAMKLAGYDHLPDSTAYYRAKRIIEKYEVKTEDQKNIMRRIGAGETRIITDMLKLSETAKSDGARVQALTTMGKWIGLDKDTGQIGTGLTIVIQAQGDAQTQINLTGQAEGPAPTAPGYEHPTSHYGKPIQITK